MAISGPFKVGDWLVEPSLDRLSQGGEERSLRPQVMELLVFLAERPGEVVSTEQLLEELWDGRIVTEGSVYNCVSELRGALTTDGDDAATVQTIPKKGYRLVAPVSTEIEPRVTRRWLFVAVAIVVLGIGALTVLIGEEEAQPIRTILVLPFDNLSPDGPSTDYIAAGMTEVVIARLGRIKELLVISRTTAQQIKARGMTVPEIRELLDVDAFIEGSVMLTEDGQLRITVQLIDARSDAHLWSRNYVRQLDDIIELQDEVANTVAAEMYARIAAAPDGTAATVAQPAPTANGEAYRAYLQGRYYFSQFGMENFRSAIDFYDEAIALDPQFALAHASRAEACSQPAVVINRILTMDDCYNAARLATQLDETLAEGHAALGMVQLLRWEWSDGGRSLDRAVDLNPNSVMARQWRTLFYRISYRFEEALDEIRIAEDRDPLNLFVRTMVSWPLYDMRRYDEALAQLNEVLALEPNFMLAQYNRGLVYIEMRDAPGVFDAADRVAAIAGPQSFEVRLLNASAYAISGDEQEARDLIAGVEADGGVFLAAWISSIYLLLGDEEAALSRLERGLEERAVDLMGITEPKFDSIRDHPRFRAVSEGLGLPLTR